MTRWAYWFTIAPSCLRQRVLSLRLDVAVAHLDGIELVAADAPAQDLLPSGCRVEGPLAVVLDDGDGHRPVRRVRPTARRRSSSSRARAAASAAPAPRRRWRSCGPAPCPRSPRGRRPAAQDGLRAPGRRTSPPRRPARRPRSPDVANCRGGVVSSGEAALARGGRAFRVAASGEQAEIPAAVPKRRAKRRAVPLISGAPLRPACRRTRLHRARPCCSPRGSCWPAHCRHVPSRAAAEPAAAAAIAPRAAPVAGARARTGVARDILIPDLVASPGPRPGAGAGAIARARAGAIARARAPVAHTGAALALTRPRRAVARAVVTGGSAVPVGGAAVAVGRAAAVLRIVLPVVVAPVAATVHVAVVDVVPIVDVDVVEVVVVVDVDVVAPPPQP